MNDPRPFNISIFVVEGIPDGLRHVEKSNWVGLGIICPRGRFPKVKEREEFSRTGVYILAGHDDEDETPKLYVGEGHVRKRLAEHYIKKDFWQQAIVFTTRGNPLEKAEVQYLEARLIEIAEANKRYKLDNDKTPQKPDLTEVHQAKVEGYLAEMLSLLPVIGIQAFEKVGATTSHPRIYQCSGKDWNASGYETNYGFSVRKGSSARMTVLPSMPPSIELLRQELIDNGVLVDQTSSLSFSRDHQFNSPSQAAALVAGCAANGREAWKDKKGITLKEHQQREVNT